MSYTTPVLIDSTNWPFFLTPQSQLWGPYEYDGKVFLLAGEESGLTNVRVYKGAVASPEGSFVECDTANRKYSLGLASPFYPGSGTKLYVANRTNTTEVTISVFDMGTETWDADITTFTTDTTSGWLHLVKSGTDYVLIYRKSSTFKLWWTKYDGASWSSPARVDGYSGSETVNGTAVVVDDDGLLHIAWGQSLGFLGHQAGYARTLDPATGTLGTIRELDADFAWAGAGTEFDDEIAYPTIRPIDFALGTARMSTGTPTSDPTWTTEEIDPSEYATDNAAVRYGGTLYYFWVDYAYQIRYVYKTAGGTWSAAVTLYDADGQSYLDGGVLTPFGVDNYIHRLSVTKLSTGDFGIMFAGYVNPYSTAFYFVATLGAPSPNAGNFAYFGSPSFGISKSSSGHGWFT
jgi:hypothetical protein